MFAFARFPVRFVARFTDGTSAIFPVERYVLRQLGEAAGYVVLRSSQRAELLPNKPVSSCQPSTGADAGHAAAVADRPRRQRAA